MIIIFACLDTKIILIPEILILENNINTFKNINPKTFSKIFKSAPKKRIQKRFRKTEKIN